MYVTYIFLLGCVGYIPFHCAASVLVRTDILWSTLLLPVPPFSILYCAAVFCPVLFCHVLSYSVPWCPVMFTTTMHITLLCCTVLS